MSANNSTPADVARERAVLVFVAVSMGFLGAFIPVLMFMTPVPIALLIYRSGYRFGMATAFVVALLNGMLLGLGLFVFLLSMLGVGVALGSALKEKFTPNQVFLAVSFVSLLVWFGLVVTGELVFGANYRVAFEEMTQVVLDQIGRTLEHAGEPEARISEIRAQWQNQIGRLWPAMVIAAASVMSFINYAALRLWLRRLGEKLPWFPPFSTWRFPWYLAWGYILGRVFSLSGNWFHGDALVTAGLNLELLFYYLFLVQGMAILFSFISRWRTSPVIWFLSVGLAFLWFPGVLFFGGLLDTWFDFRRLRSRLK